MKKICMSLILAAAMTASAVPTVYAEDIVTVTTSVVPQQNDTATTTAVSDENSLKSRMFLEDYYMSLKDFSLADAAKYKCMTPEDAYRDINGGSYICLGWHYGLTMDENGKLHMINRIEAAAVIKVKEGFDLYPDFEGEEYAPTVKLDGQYIIISGGNSDMTNEYIDSVKDNENVLSINKYYAVYEDTVNHVWIDGFSYNGEELTDEKLAEYPALSLTPNDQWVTDFDHFLSTDMNKYTGDRKDIYMEISNLKEEVQSLSPLAISTCLAPANPEVYLCSFNETIYVDGLSGDSNIDGKMDISDSVLVMQSIANPSKYGVTGENGITYQGIKNADSDGNGITNADALTIQKKLLKLN